MKNRSAALAFKRNGSTHYVEGVDCSNVDDAEFVAFREEHKIYNIETGTFQGGSFQTFYGSAENLKAMFEKFYGASQNHIKGIQEIK